MPTPIVRFAPILAVTAAISLLPAALCAESPADIKNNVAIVWPRYAEKTLATFSAMAQNYKQQANEVRALKGTGTQYSDPQLDELAARLDALAGHFAMRATSSGHGSGWFWIPDRKSESAFLVTNEHVAGQASSIALEFGRRSNHPRVKGKVVFVSRSVDLALIEVKKDDLPRTATGLTLSTRTFEEGEPVYASGYPGTDLYQGSVPAYSLSQGIISNPNVDIGSGTGATIGHTATIDPGNSGGPLLTRSPSRTFKVVGMNTSIHLVRRDLNFAIPAALIREELNKALRALETRRSPQRMAAALNKTATQLATELASSNPDNELLSHLISYAYVGERPEVIIGLTEAGRTGQLDVDDFQLVLNKPVEVARMQLFRELASSFGSTADNVGEVSFLRVLDEDKVANGGPVRSLYKVRGSNREITWIWEHGYWRIFNVSIPREKAPAKTASTGKTVPQEDSTGDSVDERVNEQGKQSVDIDLELEKTNAQRNWGLGLMVVGGAAAVTGAVFGWQSNSTNDELNDGTVRSFGENDDLISRSDTFATIGNSGIYGGAAMLALGAILWLTSDSSEASVQVGDGGIQSQVMLRW